MKKLKDLMEEVIERGMHAKKPYDSRKSIGCPLQSLAEAMK
jgi:hypothetical protein